MNDMRTGVQIDKFIIGGWTVFPVSGVLANKKGDEIYLEPRLAKLLYLLSKNANQVVRRDQLIDEIWPDTFVNEESLTKAISDLRKLLKSYFDNPPPIKTIPKRGYKLIIAVPKVNRSVWKDVLKYAAYSLLGLILLILVIRGLSY